MKEPNLQLPDHIKKLSEGEEFSFACHPGVPCFTECCRQLELALTPYDILRLQKELDISGPEFLDRYAVIESGKTDIFPQVYLGMVDDGRASCPFVSEEGCKVYAGRPAPCRTYPLGRGAWQDETGTKQAFYVLLKEPHCKGFNEPDRLTINLWIDDQELASYYKANDLMLTLLHHDKIKKGFRPTAAQQDLYLATLYDLDTFCNDKEGQCDDLEKLRLAVEYLIAELFK